MRHFALIISFAMALLMLTEPAVADEPQPDRSARQAVLVTGASSGIGRRVAEDLAAAGYLVFAGARKQADLDALNAIDNIQAVRLDVTVPAEIDAAVETIRAAGYGLYGLVNNAGVFVGGPLIEVPVDQLEWLMDINVTGVYRVTQAFAPLIIAARGRITTISSISGINTARFMGHYSMSKHAVEAYTDALAIEMEKFGVAVSAVEPGNYNSEIGTSARKRLAGVLSPETSEHYAEELAEWLDRPWERSRFKDPDEVSEAVQHFFASDEPLRRYMVVPSEGEAAWAIDKAIEEVVQYNRWQAYSYSREQLIEKLDAALRAAAARADD
jgi:NAD(P)-dependent dehydrogenase (short-subunit alcohol dehydrogenase family)